jgi:predicted ATPase
VILQKVRISNYLSIKGTIEIDIDANVTILLGSNDHGKTNILKAILHLNDDSPLVTEDRNWDVKDADASIDYEFRLDPEELQEWNSLIESLHPKTKSALDEGKDNEEEPQSDGVESELEEQPIAVPLPPLGDPKHRKITLSRTGFETELSIADIATSNLPAPLLEFLTNHKPRVELFVAAGGNLQDSVNAKQIATDEYEFMQGVFFQAGLDPRNSSALFVQDDETMRKLDEASKRLNDALSLLWGQGTDLEFELRHQADTIQFLVNDPAVKERKVRMSKRSSGVTQFFRLSMLLHARRKKNPANSYMYLFDEPGVFLHPQGQRDLLQVLEELAERNQIIYATHSLFMLNQNYPERHRLIFKDKEGTKVDHKPYRANWKLATEAFGVYLNSNILFSSRVLLVEGDSDPMYIYELFRQLNRLGTIDADSNVMGAMSFYEINNLRYLLQVFKRKGQEAEVLVLLDGDSRGQTILKKIRPLCDRLKVPILVLADMQSIEDLCLFPDAFLKAVEVTLRAALESEGKPPLIH